MTGTNRRDKMTEKLLKAMILGLALCSFSSEADTGQLQQYSESGDWFSAILHINNEDTARIGTSSLTDSGQTSLIIDLNRRNYWPKIIVAKSSNDVGNVTLSGQGMQVSCQLRIDTKQIFNNSCQIQDDNTDYYITFGSGLDSRFIEEMKSGNILRVKLGDQEPFYERFSLRGFSSAYGRAQSLSDQVTGAYGNGNENGNGDVDGSGGAGGNDSDFFSGGTRL